MVDPGHKKHFCDPYTNVIIPTQLQEFLNHQDSQTYIFWTYQNALRELLKGRKSIHVYSDLMNSVNLINLPRKTHKKYIQRVQRFVDKQ